jgi:hypothetical protein
VRLMQRASRQLKGVEAACLLMAHRVI